MRSSITKIILASTLLLSASLSQAAGRGSGAVNECQTFGVLIAEQIAVQVEPISTDRRVQNATAHIKLYRMKCGNLAVNVQYFFEDGRPMTSSNSLQQYSLVEAEVHLTSGEVIVDTNRSQTGILGLGLDYEKQARRVLVAPRHFSIVDFAL